MGLQCLTTAGAVLPARSTRKVVQYPARSSRGKWGELQGPCTVLQERCVQKGVQ